MTTQTAERETIVAQLVRFGQEQKGQKQVTVFEFKDKPDSNYATKITWWPLDKGGPAPVLKIGSYYKVAFEKIPVPLRPDGSGGKGFYRNWISAVPATGEALGVQPVPAAAVALPDALVGYEAPAAPAAAPDGYTQGELRREASIQRQVALKAAVEWGCARVATGEKVGTYHIGQMADWFAGILSGAVHTRAMTFKVSEQSAVITNEEAAEALFGPERPAVAPGASQDAPRAPAPAAAPSVAASAPARGAQAAAGRPASASPDTAGGDPETVQFEGNLETMNIIKPGHLNDALLLSRRKAWRFAQGREDKPMIKSILRNQDGEIARLKAAFERDTGLPFDEAQGADQYQ